MIRVERLPRPMSIRWTMPLLLAVLAGLTLLIGLVALLLTGTRRVQAELLVDLHLAASGLAGAAGLMQLRRRSLTPAMHRRLGYGYGAAVLLAGVSALMLAAAHGDVWQRTGLALGTGVWLGVTLIALTRARFHHARPHRAWSRLSVLVTFSFFLHPPLLVAASLVHAPRVLADWLFWLTPLALVGTQRGVRDFRFHAREHQWAFHLRRWWGAWAWQRLGMAGLGFVPIAALAAALVGLAPLSLTTVALVLPACGVALGLGLGLPIVGQRALQGWLAGMLATAIYDTFRLSGVYLGLWHDFIPLIGQLAWHDAAVSGAWGYVWRFALDGGAMAVTFAMLPPGWRTLRGGIGFGVSVCCCLFLTLLVAPQAQAQMFILSPTTVALALTGHVIYGASCAGCLRHLQRPHRTGGR